MIQKLKNGPAQVETSGGGQVEPETRPDVPARGLFEGSSRDLSLKLDLKLRPLADTLTLRPSPRGSLGLSLWLSPRESDLNLDAPQTKDGWSGVESRGEKEGDIRLFIRARGGEKGGEKGGERREGIPPSPGIRTHKDYKNRSNFVEFLPTNGNDKAGATARRQDHAPGATARPPRGHTNAPGMGRLQRPELGGGMTP